MSSHARITGIDAARGCAMVLVCFSHIKEHFIVSEPALYQGLVAITRIATPTFLLLSGFVISYLLQSSNRPRAGLALVDRGLFLLLVAHPLLGWDSWHATDPIQWLFGRVVITDAIGVSLFIAVLTRRGSAAFLLAAGFALALLSWPIGATLAAESRGGQLLGAVLFSVKSAENPAVDVALVPYVGVFLIGMGLCRLSARAVETGDTSTLARRFLWLGGSAVLAAGAGLALWHFLHPFVQTALEDAQLMKVLRETVDPRTKWPPSPGYVLFYGGLGLIMTAVLLIAERYVPKVVSVPAVIGRASLMAFVVQDWLLRFAPRVLGFDDQSSVAFWAMYIATVLLLIYALARQWDRRQGNRFLTVGLKALGAKLANRGQRLEQTSSDPPQAIGRY